VTGAEAVITNMTKAAKRMRLLLFGLIGTVRFVV